LIDFAISSYISDKKKGIEQDIPSLEEINSYIDEKNNNLNYDPKHVTKIVALMAAQSNAAIAFTVETLACNRKLKEVLVKEFVASRYSNYERRKELDDTPTSCEVNINGKERHMSKTTLNRNIATLNADNELEFFNPNSNNPTGVSPQSRLQ